MNEDKNPIGIAIVVVIVILLAVAAIWFMRGSESENPEERLAAISEEDARELLNCRGERVEDRYVKCDIEVGLPTTQGQKVTATYMGLFDDSVAAARTEAIIVFENGEFVIATTTETFQCQAGRGHQDFTTEPCV